ncbi:MAG: PQQ-binding-like beta-propeller repeat protein [Acidimicrobiia bacterium]|nr:PQQ-binding-like beta-propeller repeat protein [Acidimicrobiia bacterium]
MSRARRRTTIAVALAALLGATVPAVVATGSATAQPASRASTDWPTYGRSDQRDFVAPTTLTPLSVQTLAPKWFFSTGDAVTAQPIVVGSTVYVGSWDGNFYAIDSATGTLQWKFGLDQQPAIFPPSTGRTPADLQQDTTSDGGLVTSTAAFVPATSKHPDLVVFGGGFTLYALRTGALPAGVSRLYWKHVYSGLPGAPPDPAGDSTRIFASPAVVGDQVLFGVSTDGESGHRGYFSSADLVTGNENWRVETDVDQTGAILNNGCGGVWASPTIDDADNLAVFGISDCNSVASPAPFAERLLGVRINKKLPIGTSRVAWAFTPPRVAQGDVACDFDFGATANYGHLPNGTPFVGAGNKDGTFYALDPRPAKATLDPTTGLPGPHLLWATNVVFGGPAGGFIAPSAFDGQNVYASTAIGDFGVPPSQCEPGNPRDLPVQEPSGYSFNASSGATRWSQPNSQDFGAVSEAGGMTFSATAISNQLQIRDAGTGLPLRIIPLPAPSNSGVVVSGDSIYFGTGGPQQGSPDGVYGFSPLGSLPNPPGVGGVGGLPTPPSVTGLPVLGPLLSSLFAVLKSLLGLGS